MLYANTPLKRLEMPNANMLQLTVLLHMQLWLVEPKQSHSSRSCVMGRNKKKTNKKKQRGASKQYCTI
jgi:hypothetical protein